MAKTMSVNGYNVVKKQESLAIVELIKSRDVGLETLPLADLEDEGLNLAPLLRARSRHCCQGHEDLEQSRQAKE
jgi:hypothetical protein